MKGYFFLLAFTLLLPPGAEGGDLSFPEAFRAYGKLRALEEEKAVVKGRDDIDEGTREGQLAENATELAAARTALRSFLGNGSSLSEAEKKILRAAHPGNKARAVDSAGLAFLSSSFGAAARAWSPLDWDCAADWFGQPTADAFLKKTFSVEALAGAPAPGERHLVWVSDPSTRYLPKAEADRRLEEQVKLQERLKAQGFTVENLEVGAFSHLDEQAEGVHLALAARATSGEPGFVLVSAGYGSAVLLRAFDLNPGLLHYPAVQGWVNVNGKLFGAESAAFRAPASATRADRPLLDAHQELLLLRGERTHASLRLMAPFPVLNLVTWEGSRRPGKSLRDSLVPDGKTVYLPSGDGLQELGRALPAMGTLPADGPVNALAD